MIDHATPDLFLAALSLRDFERFADCLAPSAEARMHLPRGFEVRTGRDEIDLLCSGFLDQEES